MTQDVDTTARRLRLALEETAQQLRVTPRTPPSAEDRRDRRPRNRLLFAGVAATAVVVAIATIGVRTTDHTSPDVQTSGPPTQVAPQRLLRLEADVLVYLNVDATDTQIQAVRGALGRSARVRAFAFVDKAAALNEFRRVYRDQPDLVRNITAGALPVELRVSARRCSDRTALVAMLRNQPGIDTAAVGISLPHRLAQRYDNASYQWLTLPVDRVQLPPVALRGRCGQRIPSRSR